MKRILLKISGEALSSSEKNIDSIQVKVLAAMVEEIQKIGIELVLVLWWGNIYRGSQLIEAGVDPADSHNMSMLSTVFNSLTLKNFLEAQGIESVVLDALWVEFLQEYTAIKAREYIKKWKIVICSSGTGTPFFTTDTTGVLRALELHCDAMIKLTKVDGVYDSDPMTNPQAKKSEDISYDAFIAQNLKVLDQTAIILARDNKLPVYVSKLDDIQSILKILRGEKAGTKIGS